MSEDNPLLATISLAEYLEVKADYQHLRETMEVISNRGALIARELAILALAATREHL